MSEQQPVFDVFSQCASLIDNICQLQRALVDDTFDRAQSEDRTVVDTVTECWRNLYNGVAHNPDRVAEQQINFWQDQLQLCSNFALKLMGSPAEPVVEPQPGDRRFTDSAWDENALFDFIKQSYLLTAQYTMNCVERLDGVDARHRERLVYFMRQLVNALAPTNFPLTNPEVIRKTIDTRGENLVEGLRMMAEDKKKSAEILNICMSSPNAFELGRNIAATPGAVVAENELMQLIQYAPVTPEVRRTPVLIVPSWVNKYYILDLTPQNSYIHWLVEQGYTVFTISWVNPDARFRHVQFADYMRLGPLAALDTIERLTGERQVSAVGYCLGGVLLACTLAYSDAGPDRRFATATYLTTSIDFSDPSDIGIFVDEPLIASVERQMQRQGYCDGRLLAASFNLLKENDLFWNYYVINYLKGERPAAFDLLHWNSDSTHVPEAAHRFVMRELHLHNRLMQPGAIALNGRAIDLRCIVTPTYVLATDKDHIARWRSCYAATQHQGGEMRFVLAGSGHIAGVINPPQSQKYYHYTNQQLPREADDWLRGASRIDGSWWTDWLAWQGGYSGPRLPARAIDDSAIIEAAPGRYVRQRLDGYAGRRDAA